VKKRIVIGLSVLMAAVFIFASACGRETAAPASAPPSGGTESGLPFVELDWYTGLGIPQDAQMVNDYLNEYLMEKINTKVNFIFMQSAEWRDRMAPLFASGQDLGVVAFGNQASVSFINQAKQGSYAPLEDLLTEYAPGTKALFSDAIWKAVTVDGHIYGVPSLKDNCYFITTIYNKTMAENLGIDMTKYPTFKNFDQPDYEALLYEVKEKRAEKYPEWNDRPVLWPYNDVWPFHFAFETFISQNYGVVCNIPGIMDVSGYDAYTIFNMYETPEFLQYARTRVKHVMDGIVAYDYDGKDDWWDDGSLFGWSNWGLVYAVPDLYSDLFDIEVIMPERIWTATFNLQGAGVAVSSNNPNPERCAMVIEIMNTDPFFATTTRFGIEGQHYLRGDDGKMTFDGSPRNGDPANRGYHHWYGAPLGNLFIVEAPESYTGPDGIMYDLLNKYNREAIIPNHMGFVFDTENVLTEVAALASVIGEYQSTIYDGILPSLEAVDTFVDEFNAKLKANGLDKVTDELVKQIAAWK